MSRLAYRGKVVQHVGAWSVLGWGLAGLGWLSAGGGAAQVVPAETRAADLVVHNANVLTVNTRAPHATAFAVSDGKFVVVGGRADVLPLIGGKTVVMDLAGRTVVPGFIDAHLHPRPIYPEDAPWAAVDVSPAKVRTMEELIAALRRKAERTPAGQWVTGARYQETKLGRHPTRHDLDLASTNHPIIISHSSGHQSVCNTLALQMAKVRRDTPDPPGGKFVRDAQGEPTGWLQESAAARVRSAGPRRPTPSRAELLEGYRECFRAYLRRGVTSVGVAGGSFELARQLAQARTTNEPIRFNMMVSSSALAELQQRKKEGRLGDADMRFGAVKFFHGNSLSGQTCWLSEPYTHRPDYYGVPPARSQGRLNELVLSIHRAGLQACVHANGDREITMLLDAFEAALEAHPRPGHRHRIEHCSIVNERILQRIRQLGMVMVLHSYLYEHGDKMEVYGPARWDWMQAARSALDLGIPVAGHSDDPVSVADPLLRIQDMVMRTSAEGKVHGPRQRITVEEALRVWTLGGAYAAFEEGMKGSIEAGKLADFVVLSADPTRVAPETIKDIRVEKTVIGGRVVYAR